MSKMIVIKWIDNCGKTESHAVKTYIKKREGKKIFIIFNSNGSNFKVENHRIVSITKKEM